MHYMLGVRIDESAPAYTDEERDAMFARVGAVNDEMKAAGIWVFAGGLATSPSTTVVRADSGTPTMTDGPFVETKEQIGGVYVIEADDLDVALRWAGKVTAACGVPIEVRPFDGVG